MMKRRPYTASSTVFLTLEEPRTMMFPTTALKAMALTLLALTFSACALSPQHVELMPSVEVTSRLPVAHIVSLSIEDQRPQNYLGTRGGVYADTSYIYPATSLQQSLRPAALQALQQLGLQTEGVSPQPILIKLVIEQLSYQMDDRALPKKVTLNTRIRAELTRGTQQHQGNFNSAKVYNFVKSPSAEQNQKIVNEILSETLTRLFNDPQLLAFLQR